VADVAVSGVTSRGDVVVVGVDGSPASIDALRWALSLAKVRCWDVEVVTAWPEAGAVLVHQVPGHCCAPRERAVSAQARAMATAVGGGAGGPRVMPLVVNAHPVEALLEHAAGARMLVVGSHGQCPGRARPGTRPSVATTVAHLASCPVVVVGEEAHPAPVPQGV